MLGGRVAPFILLVLVITGSLGNCVMRPLRKGLPKGFVLRLFCPYSFS